MSGGTRDYSGTKRLLMNYTAAIISARLVHQIPLPSAEALYVCGCAERTLSRGGN